jgi:glucosamine--fructose-6-phosphate aminotransferase (isomerizing)
MEIEARESPDVAARLVADSETLARLGARLRSQRPRYALTMGRGSSSAAALLAKYLFELRAGVPTASVTPSVRSVYGRALELEDALLVTISQSGKSPDLVEFCRNATGPHVLRVGLINDASSPLALAVDECLPLRAGAEQSVAATKSCIAAMALAFGLTAYWLEDAAMMAAFERLAATLSDALARDWPDGARFLGGDGPLYVVGRGPALAIAKEAALKLKETNRLFAEAVSGAELRHGPLALAGPDLRVVIFAPRDAAFESMLKLKDDLEARGSPVLFICSDSQYSRTLVAHDDEAVLELLAMLLRFYLLANESALKRGLSPDHPPQLSKITETR